MLLRNYLNNVSGKSKSDIISLDGGLNTCTDRTFIRDNQMPYMWNVGIFDSPVLQTRRERVSIATHMDDVSLYAKGQVFYMLPVSTGRVRNELIYTIEYNPEVNDIPDDDEGGTPGHNPDDDVVDDEGGNGEHFPNEGDEEEGAGGSPAHNDDDVVVTEEDDNEPDPTIRQRLTANNNLSFEPETVLGIYQYKITSVAGTIEKKYIGAIEYGTGTFSMEYWQGEVDATEGTYASQGEFVMASNGAKRVWFQGLAFDVDPEPEDYHVETTYPGILQMHKNRMFVANQNILTFSNLAQPTNFIVTETYDSIDDFPATGKENVRYYDKTNKKMYVWENNDYEETEATDVTNTAGQILIQNAKGKITAIQSFDDKLIIFCEHSRHILYGTSPNAEVDMYQLVDMDDDVGCISNKSICVCNRNLYWVANDLSVYRYNGASTYKISEPNGSDNYAQYGGIKGLKNNPYNNISMGASGDLVYISIRLKQDILINKSDTALVYNTATRVWWAEDGAFSAYCNWERLDGTEDELIGAMYNGDLVIINGGNKTGMDMLYDTTTEEIYGKVIEYAFETKTWNLGQIQHKKTLTNVWFQSNADAKVAVTDYWSKHDPWKAEETDIDTDYLVIGKMQPVTARHNIHSPNYLVHEGGERQRFIIPRMYMQKINTFAIRVQGTGLGYFYMMEKEWRIR